MFDRKAIKEKGKECFKRNYWRTVLVTALVTIITGGYIIFVIPSNEVRTFVGTVGSGRYTISGMLADCSDINKDIFLNNQTNIEVDDKTNSIDKRENSKLQGTTMPQVAFVVFTITYLLTLAVMLAINILILNPIYVGGMGYYYNNTVKKVKLNLLGIGFKKASFKNIVVVILLKNIFNFLWIMLFIIPGIIKYYEYRMIPYIIADNPSLNWKEVFKMSKEIMHGNKWKIFIFDISFLGWWILSVLTFGVLAVFYVNPYKRQSDAVIYESLLKQDDNKTEYENYLEV